MNIEKEILNIVSEITNNKVDNSKLKTPLHEINGWNSLNHALTMNKIEEIFNIEFDIDELIGFENLNEICFNIKNKLGIK